MALGAALSSFGGQIQQFIAQRKQEAEDKRKEALAAQYHNEDQAFREKQFGLQKDEAGRQLQAFLEGQKQNEFERGTKQYELAGAGGDITPEQAATFQKLGLPGVTQRTDEMGNQENSFFRKANPLEQNALNEQSASAAEKAKKAALLAGLNPQQQVRAELGFDPSEPGYIEKQKIEQQNALARIAAQVGPQIKSADRQVQAEVLRAINSLKQGLDESPEQYQQRASLLVQQLETMGVKIDDESKKALTGEGGPAANPFADTAAPAAGGPSMIDKFLSSMGFSGDKGNVPAGLPSKNEPFPSVQVQNGKFGIVAPPVPPKRIPGR